MATLQGETMLLECFFLEQFGEGDDLLAVVTAESFERSREAVERSLHEFDADHQEFRRDTWESGRRLELLVELNRIGGGR